jgi:hypothetical protein
LLAYAATKLNPALAASSAPLFMSEPSLAMVTYNPLLDALIEYTPDAAPTFWRMVKRYHVDAAARIAASV